MPGFTDGPKSSLFTPIPLKGNTTLKKLEQGPVSNDLKEILPEAPRGACVFHGIPFSVNKVVLLKDNSVTVPVDPVQASWLIFAHALDTDILKPNKDGFYPASTGWGQLNKHVADYVMVYDDGTEEHCDIRSRHHIAMARRLSWGENSFQCVAHAKPFSVRAHHEQPDGTAYWGSSQTRANAGDLMAYLTWLWAWENPHPEKTITAFRFEAKKSTLIVSGITAGQVSSNPLRWQSRHKALLKLPKGVTFDPTLDAQGVLNTIQLDLGQVISALPRQVYPNDAWPQSYDRKPPKLSKNEVLLEYTAHPEAEFHLAAEKTVPVAKLNPKRSTGGIRVVPPARQRITIRVVEKESGKPVAVRLHVHGESGEYLAPLDRHRYPNTAWFEDYAPEFQAHGSHNCTYIDGETDILLPLGKVYIEVSKGLEIKPIRKVVTVKPGSKTISLSIKRVLPWRDNGWVTADTHVHFLSPPTAHLEGAGEGINIVNLLASQWGELMTNAGDFDGKTTYGSKEAGGDGEFMVRVGTENRQHVMGHISLLGYQGRMIAPMTTGGPDESALGDPIDVLLTEWARQCHAQGGLVVLPHFPNPRAEHAASIIHGEIDAIEMASWDNIQGGIDPYSLSDWYRYLNCGYFVPAVAGTDKMAAPTPVGAVRTYAKLPQGKAFAYNAWMEAVRSGNTFVTYGPLMEFSVEGKPAGSHINMSASGGTVDVAWQVASVTRPMTRVELIVNGEIRESKAIGPRSAQGTFTVKADRSAWIALLVRGHQPGCPEFIAAHSSPVMVHVEGSPFFAAADAMTILEQIEGALAYFDVLGTKAEDKAYKRMRLVLTSAHRALHNRMHQGGIGHQHTHATDHPEHHK